MKSIQYLLLFILIVTAHQSVAQFGQKNLQAFDRKPIHFGFVIGYNTSDFYVKYNPDYTFTDSLISVLNEKQPGFNLNILASLNMTKNIRLRFAPGLSFQDRNLNYTFALANGKEEILKRRIESVYLDIPLTLKLRTNRVGNFAAAALIGAKYSIDMQSQKDVKNSGDDIIVKVQRDD